MKTKTAKQIVEKLEELMGDAAVAVQHYQKQGNTSNEYHYALGARNQLAVLWSWIKEEDA